MNEAEYHGLLSGPQSAADRGISKLFIVGNSRIVIQQAQPLINCNTAGLQRLLAQHESTASNMKNVQLIHVEREFNSASDYITGQVLITRATITSDDISELELMQSLDRIHEKVMKPGTAAPAAPDYGPHGGPAAADGGVDTRDTSTARSDTPNGPAIATKETAQAHLALSSATVHLAVTRAAYQSK